MGLEEKFHKKMVKIMLGGLAPLEEEEKKGLVSEVKEALKPKIRTISSFFSSGIKELKRDLAKVKKANKPDQE